MRVLSWRYCCDITDLGFRLQYTTQCHPLQNWTLEGVETAWRPEPDGAVSFIIVEITGEVHMKGKEMREVFMGAGDEQRKKGIFDSVSCLDDGAYS